MKTLTYIKDKQKRTAWLRAFRMWQHRPYEVAPLSEETRKCASCKTVFEGNFCPRCGQSAKVGRFSFKAALLNFLDVWGMGNRSMFRSIRDLMFRPGYMIRDYLRGMQSAYFPPFKMFFILAAISLIVEHGFNLKTEKAEAKEQIKTEILEQQKELQGAGMNIAIGEPDVKSPMYQYGVRFAETMNTLQDKNPAIFALLSLVLFFLPLYTFLRSSPAIPDFRFSEFIIALVYTSNAFSIFSITGNILNSGILKILAVLMAFIALKQLSGYSKCRLFCYLLLTFLISFIALVCLVAIAIYILYLTTPSAGCPPVK